jgi:hypothetical protein
VVPTAKRSWVEQVMGLHPARLPRWTSGTTASMTKHSRLWRVEFTDAPDRLAGLPKRCATVG